jgi:hypothetical protein
MHAAPRTLLAALLPILLAGCERAAPVPDGDTAAPAEPQAAATPAPWSGEWSPAFGTILIVPSDTDNTGILVYPDAIPAGATPAIDLMTAGGEMAAAAVTIAGADSLECGSAPVLRLSAGSFGTWAIGVRAPRGILRSDSVEALAGADSARVVTQLARMASMIDPNEESRFTGLPFNVANARRYTVGNTRLVAAHLVRRLPQEASPLEQHTFMIAERALFADSLALRYSERSEGTEESAEHFEILAALAGESGTLLLIARDNTSGTRYEILERSATGSWRVRWARPLSC